MSFKLTPLALLLSTLSLTSLTSQASCPANFTPVAAIQGAGEQSPLVGKTLQTRAVVQTVLYAGSKNPQLLLTSVTPDADPRTSEAILLPDSQQAALYKAGDVLQLTGTVRELSGMTALTNITALQHCGRQPVAAAVSLSLPVQALSDWEALEGMLLTFKQPLIVNDSYGLARYGELMLSSRRQPVATEVVRPGPDSKALIARQLLDELVLDDGSTAQNPQPVPYPAQGLSASQTVRVGDTVQQLSGYLLQTKAGYRLIPAKAPQIVASNPRPGNPPARKADELRVASFNVLNFFTGDGSANAFPTRRGASTPEELTRQQAKMLAALSAMDADIIGLLEVENNGFAQGSALVTLVQSLNQQLGSDSYALIQPADKPGSDDIMVALIYRKATVSPTGHAALNLKPPFNKGSRPPLAQSFRHQASGEQLTVSINHFKSKGSCPKQAGPDADQGDGQGCWTASRVAAANALHSWLQTTPTGVTTAYQLIIGDLNAYRQEEPLQALEQAGWQHLANAGELHSSFVFKGRSGTLDHALATPALKAKLQQFHHWGINADEPAVLDYNMEFKSKAQQQSLYAPTPYRSSDHDPLYMDFKF